jgi:hypothetical protein
LAKSHKRLLEFAVIADIFSSCTTYVDPVNDSVTVRPVDRKLIPHAPSCVLGVSVPHLIAPTTRSSAWRFTVMDCTVRPAVFHGGSKTHLVAESLRAPCRNVNVSP